MTSFYVDASGKYLGGFDGVEPPVGAIEVPSPPNDARDLWNGGGWVVAHNPAILAQIIALEATVTQRRLREAMLGVDNGWLAALNSQIAALRQGEQP